MRQYYEASYVKLKLISAIASPTVDSIPSPSLYVIAMEPRSFPSRVPFPLRYLRLLLLRVVVAKGHLLLHFKIHPIVVAPLRIYHFADRILRILANRIHLVEK